LFAYPVLMAIVFAETGLLVGFFLPGDSLLVTAGVLVNAGLLNPLELSDAVRKEVDLHDGLDVTLRCDGCEADVTAQVSYVSNEPEYTPPVIYSNETRAKLVFMVEARPSVANAPRLRPGQPVTVTLR